MAGTHRDDVELLVSKSHIDRERLSLAVLRIRPIRIGRFAQRRQAEGEVAEHRVEGLGLVSVPLPKCDHRVDIAIDTRPAEELAI